MSKTYRDRPAKQRDIMVKKHERGDHKKMEPYRRNKKNDWEN